jgi:hypothetical protein
MEWNATAETLSDRESSANNSPGSASGHAKEMLNESPAVNGEGGIAITGRLHVDEDFRF